VCFLENVLRILVLLDHYSQQTDEPTLKGSG
jgi:hypothetical protein